MTPQFLQEMGRVVLRTFEQFNLQADGVITGFGSEWVPFTDEEMSHVVIVMFQQAIDMAGLPGKAFSFLAYHVYVGTPELGQEGLVRRQFPPQVAVKGYGYHGLHQLDLMKRNPILLATEIRTWLRTPHSTEV